MKSLDELLEMNEYERAEYLYKEARKLGKRLNPEYEEIIKINPKYTCWYAEDIIEGRWKEAEKYIMKDLYWAYQYAVHIIKGRWSEIESIIIKSPELAYKYAKNY